MKNKILFLLHLPPPVHGSSMVGEFIKKSKVINNNFDCDYLNILASSKVDETGKVSVSKLLGFIKIWVQLFIKLIKNKPDLCYVAITASGAAFFRDVILIALLKVFNVKRIYHMHNKGVSKFQNNKVYNSCYRFIFKNTDVILLSKFLYTDIQKYVEEDNIHICPNGIPTVEYRLIEKKDNENVNILFLSNLIQSKGVFVLLEACKLLKDEGVLFDCNFIGGEGDITEIQFNQKVKELELVNQVNYLGKKYSDEKNQYFLEADIFAFPTYYENETFGLVNLEAMQAELPVISTFEGGIPDIVEDNVTGFLVLQKDVVSLANKLEYLINNKELRNEMGIKGRTKFEKEFTLEKFERRMSSILLNTIEKNKNATKN